MELLSSTTEPWHPRPSKLDSVHSGKNTGWGNFEVVVRVVVRVGHLVSNLVVALVSLVLAVFFSDVSRTRYLNGGASAGANLVSLILPTDTRIIAITLNAYVNSAGGGDAWYVWLTDNQVVPLVNDVELQGVLLTLRGIVLGVTPGYNGHASTNISGISYKISRNGLLCLHTRAAAGQVTAQAVIHA